jgi:hypothetical protein
VSAAVVRLLPPPTIIISLITTTPTIRLLPVIIQRQPIRPPTITTKLPPRLLPIPPSGTLATLTWTPSPPITLPKVLLLLPLQKLPLLPTVVASTE